MTDPIKLRILVVEDDARMLDLLCRGLREYGHAVMPASDGQSGLELAIGFTFDVIVLDIGLPYHDGYEITRALRSCDRRVPILMLTARDTEEDIVRGLELGGDDYLTKPFSFRELVARIRTLARTARLCLDCRSLELDPARLTVMREKALIQLTRAEFALLKSLTQAGGAPVTRRQLIGFIWNEQYNASQNALDVLVNSLRSKLDAPFQSKMIETVRGIGYRLRARNSFGEIQAGELGA